MSAHRPAHSFRTARLVGVGLVAALLVAIAVVVVRASSPDPASPATAGDVVSPANLTTDGWIAVGDGPVTVAIYFDYLCPACGAFESASGDTLDRMLESGDITVELRPMAFLDRLSAGTAYSTRAANALATVADAEPDLAWDLHRALYAHQPAEGREGLTDDQLAGLAREAGVPEEVASTFADGRFEAWTAERTERASTDGVEGTPTVLVDGEVVDDVSPAGLSAAVRQAGSGATG